MTPALLLLVALAGADDAPISLRMEIDQKQVAQGDSFRLDVVLTVRGQQQVEELSLPDVPRAFTVTQERRATSTQVGSVNGKSSVTTEQRYMFVLRADEAGSHRIGEASARLGRAVARAAPVTIKVAAGDAVDDEPAATGPQPGARFGAETPVAFLEVTVDKQTVWTGEQLTITTQVYSQQPLSQWPRIPPLKPAGFFCVPLLGDDRPTPGQKSIGGRLYYVYLVNKDALFATSPGAKTIPAQSVDLVPAGSFFNQSRGMQVKSAKLPLTVKPLPDDRSALRTPESFAAGNVGHWQLTAAVRPTTATLGQPFTLTLAATGSGNLDQLQLPSWDGGGLARVFPPTSRIERRGTSADEPEIGGRVTAEMLVQPLREGDLKIPAFTLVTFDPESGSYKELTSAAIVVTVRSAKGAVAGSTSSARQVIAKGARPLHALVNLERAPDEVPVIAGAACALLGAGALAFGTQRRRRRSSNEGQREAARRERASALEDARRLGDLSALERLVVDALADSFGPAVRSSSTVELEDALLARGAGRALIDEVVRFIREVEAARYMRGGATGERERMAKAAVDLIARIDGGAP